MPIDACDIQQFIYTSDVLRFFYRQVIQNQTGRLRVNYFVIHSFENYASHAAFVMTFTELSGLLGRKIVHRIAI